MQEEWNALVSENSPLAKKDVLTPQDFDGIPLILARRELAKNHIYNWLGEYADENNIIANGNLLYNIAIIAKNTMSSIIAIKLDCEYKDLKYIPLSPKLVSGTVLIWKKTQTFSKAAEAFIKHLKEMPIQHF